MKDIESQTAVAKPSRLRVSKRIATLLMLCAACALMVLFNVHSSTHTAVSRDLLKAGEGTGGGSPTPIQEFFAGYIARMEEKFTSFRFLPHADEAKYEAEWFKSHGKGAFEAKYKNTSFSEYKNYVLASVGTSSTQGVVRSESSVESVVGNGWESIGTDAMRDEREMDDSAMEAFLRELKQLRIDRFGDAKTAQIVMCNAIGYAANDYRGKDDTTWVELGQLSRETPVATEEGKARPAIKRLDKAAKKVVLLNAYVKPRVKPKIENFWAKQVAMNMYKEKAIAVVDCGGGKGKNTWVYRGGDADSFTSVKDDAGTTVNDMFAASPKNNRADGRSFADRIIGQMVNALELKKTRGEGGCRRIHFYQTGKMRKAYFENFVKM